MKAQQFFKGLSWLILLNLLVKPAWIFLIDRRVQNIVGHDVYGTYFALFNFSYVLLFVADAGLTNMLTQKLAAREAMNVRQLLFLKLLLLFVYGVACFSLAAATGVSEWQVLSWLVLIQGLHSLFLFLRSLLTAQQYFGTDAYFSVLDKTLLLLLCIGPVYGFFVRVTILLFLQLQAFSVALAVSSLIIVLLRKKAWPGGHRLPVRTLATWALPFVLIVLLMSAHNRLDAFLLERLHPDGAVQAGIYAMAYRLLDAGNMIGYLTASFLMPFLSRHREEKTVVEKVVLLSRHGLLFLSAVAVAFCAVFSLWLQQTLYHTTDVYSSHVLLLTLASLPAYYLVQVYGSLLTASGFLKKFTWILLGAALLNVSLNLLLIPGYGAIGCAFAALATQYGCGLALWLAASRTTGIALSPGTFLLYLVAALLFAALFYSGQRLTDNVWIILSSIALPGLVLLFALRNRLRKIILPLFK